MLVQLLGVRRIGSDWVESDRVECDNIDCVFVFDYDFTLCIV